MIPVHVYSDGRENETLRAILRRGAAFTPEMEHGVRAILKEVEERGDVACYECTVRFDGVTIRPEAMQVTEDEFEEAYEKIETSLFQLIKRAAGNVARYHKHEKAVSWRMRGPGGAVLGQDWSPLDLVGAYVPGGRAAYPSTVLMTAIPARAAGVGETVICTPPQRDARVHPATLVAAREVGVKRVFKVGGPQAIAAMAYGTKLIPRVDKIVGPGNTYVQLAKKLVFGEVDIDMIAGPSELVVLADAHANPKLIAADLLAQAEHDEQSTVVCVTDSTKLAPKVIRHLKIQLSDLTRSQIAERSLTQHGAVILVDSLESGADLVNKIAPEHCEVLVKHPNDVLKRIKHAGAVFLGPWTPVAMGDYWAGPSHVLPTGGTGRFASVLGVHDFLKRRSFVTYGRGAFKQARDPVIAFAMAEGLQAHARSVSIRER